MVSSYLPKPRRTARWHWSMVAPLLLAMFSHHAQAVDPASPQAAQRYRIAPGDKIGVTVFGQPDLSAEATVDQTGNIRLPVIGDVRAANLVLTELEGSIEQSLVQGYVRRPKVSVKIAEFRPIHVIGLVRTPGLYPYQQGQSLFAAIMRAGGIGTPEQGGNGGDFFQADQRVRLLQIDRAALLARRARLIAFADNSDRIDFSDLSASDIDASRLAQIRTSEQRAFAAERTAERQETEVLRGQISRLEAEIALLKRQGDLGLRQRDPSQGNVGRFSGDVKRDEARVEIDLARLKYELLKAELAAGELRFKIAELHSNYQRRAIAELRETERSLLELSVTLPSAQRSRAARAGQMGLFADDQEDSPTIGIIRPSGTLTVKYDAAIGFLLLPGDVVQVGSRQLPLSEQPAKELSENRQKDGERTVRRPEDSAQLRGAAAGLARAQP
jgi:polysaccharide export outer membrane protein